MTEANDQTREFFAHLTAHVAELVAPGGRFETLGLHVDQDFRGLKYDVFAVRVRNDGQGTGRGIMEIHHYDF